METLPNPSAMSINATQLSGRSASTRSEWVTYGINLEDLLPAINLESPICWSALSRGGLLNHLLVV